MKALKIALAVSVIVATSQAYAANPGNPAELPTTASITVLNPLLITEDNTGPGMVFPTTVAPATGATALTVGSTTDAYFDVANSSDTYDFYTTDTGVSEIDCTAGEVTLALSSLGSTMANPHKYRVHGDITVQPNASDITHTCNYSVFAEYQ